MHLCAFSCCFTCLNVSPIKILSLRPIVLPCTFVWLSEIVYNDNSSILRKNVLVLSSRVPVGPSLLISTSPPNSRPTLVFSSNQSQFQSRLGELCCLDQRHSLHHYLCCHESSNFLSLVTWTLFPMIFFYMCDQRMFCSVYFYR